MNAHIVIVGAGGHGRVVLSAILAQGVYEVSGFVDAGLPVGTPVALGISVVAHQDDITAIKNVASAFVAAIGNNSARAEVYRHFCTFLTPVTVVHPWSMVDPLARIGTGSVCLAGAVVGAGVDIGQNCIINAGVIIDHDTTVGDHAHLSIGTVVRSRSIIPSTFTSEVGARL